MTLVLLAAGLGSRYGGLKQIEPVGPNGETLMDYSILDAQRAGFDRVAFIIRRDFEDAFRASILKKIPASLRVELAFQSHDDLPAPFTRPVHREKPWGTTHALLAARELLDDNFVVINADDFYGLESFANHAKFFGMVGKCSISNREFSTGNCASKQIPVENSLLDIEHSNSLPRFAMAGYRLQNTLSPHGTVARGVCRAFENGTLLSIREHTQIRALPNGAAEDIADPANPVPFTGDEPVSLNNWAFTPEVVPLLSEYFAEWLAENHANPKTECYLPTAVGHFIARGLATVEVLPCSAPWFGVTYKEDLPEVKARLAALYGVST